MDWNSVDAMTAVKKNPLNSRNPPVELLNLANGKLTLVGGLNNPQILFNGRVNEVRTAVEELLRAGVRLVAPECAVPLRTPNRNLQAIVRAVRDFSRRQREHGEKQHCSS